MPIPPTVMPWFLGGEGGRQPAPLHPRKPSPVPSDGALRLVSPMVGAGVLARLVDDPVHQPPDGRGGPARGLHPGWGG